MRGEITEALPSYKVLLSSFPGMKPNSIIETLTGTSEFAELLLNRVLPRTGVSMVMSPQTRDAAVKASLVQMFEENQDLRTAYLDAAKTRDSMKTDMPDDFPLYKHGFGGIVKDYTTAFNGVWRQLFEKGSGKQGITAQRRSLFLDELNEFREADKERFDRMFHMAEGTDADSEVTENSSIRAFMPTSGSVHANSPSQVLAAGRSLAQAKKAVNQFRKLSESLSEGKHAYDRKAAEYLQNLSDKNPDLFGKLFASADEDGEAPGKLLDLRREGKDRLLLEMSPEGVKLPSVPAGYPSVLDYNKLTKYPTVRALLLGFKAEGKDTDLATTLSNTMEELGPETIVNDVKARLRYSKETDDSGSELGETITHAMSKNIEEALHDAMKGNPGFEATGKVLKKVDFSRTRAIAKASTLADLFDAAKASYEAAVVKKELLARYKGKDAKPSDPEVQKATLLQHFRKLLYKEPEQFVRAILDFAKDKEAVASIPDAGEREILESLVAAKAQPKVRGKKKKNEEDSGEPAEAPEALSKKASDDLLMLTVISNTYSNIFHA